MTNEARPRRTTTTYVPDRATVRVAVPRGWARGVLAGVEAAFAGWAITTVLTMVAYLSIRSNTWMNDTTPRDALGLGGDLWSAVVGGTTVVGGVSYRAIPTLVGVLLVVLVRILLRATAGFPRSSALFAVPGFLLTSWLLVGASGQHSHWWTGTLGAIIIPLVGSVWFVASGYSRDDGAPAMQHWISGGFKMGGLLVVALALAASVASIVALSLSWTRVSGIHELLGASSAADSTFIVGVQVLFAPSVVAWAAAWWSGAGFLTATDALHSPSAADQGPIPPIPLLGAVPESAPGMWLILLPILLGLAVGAVCAWRFRREHLLHQSAQGLLATAVFAAVAALWMWSATMSLGAVRLSAMGPRVGWVTLALVLEIALPAVLVSLATHPTTLALIGEGTERVRRRGEAAGRRASEVAASETSAASASGGSDEGGEDGASDERRGRGGDAHEANEPWAQPAQEEHID